MGFGSATFRRVGAGEARDLVVLVVYLAGVSQAIGNGVVLFLNRVPRLRFALSLALMGAIHLIGALVTAAAALLIADLVFGRDLAFVPTHRGDRAGAGAAAARLPDPRPLPRRAPRPGPRRLGADPRALRAAPRRSGCRSQRAALLALLGWGAIRVLAFVFGRPLTYVVDGAAATPPPAGR